MASTAPVCPVPKEQQPLQEYEMLRESWFFRWATLDLIRYIRLLLILWGVGWVISSPIATVSFPFAKEPLYFGLSASAGALFIPILVLFRLYLGWFYIRNRLHDETVVYEESGWYDGQTWEKPAEVVQRDRLIATYQIRPILNRLQLTFAAILGCCVIGACIWQVASL
jgi:hypothetical protein